VIWFPVEDKIGVQLVTLNLFPEEERFGGKGDNAKSICARGQNWCVSSDYKGCTELKENWSVGQNCKIFSQPERIVVGRTLK